MQRFEGTLDVLAELTAGEDGQALTRTRLRNQADFYSLFGGLERHLGGGISVDVGGWRDLLADFARRVDDEDARSKDQGLRTYYEAARSASNDTGPRQTRIGIIERLLAGQPLLTQGDTG